MDVTFTDQAPAAVVADLLAVGIRGDLTPALVAALGDHGKTVAAHLSDVGFEPKAGTVTLLPTFGAIRAKQLAVVGLGDGGVGELSASAGKLGLVARDAKAKTLAVAFGALDADGVRAVLELVSVGNYFDERYLPEKQRKPAITSVAFVGTAPATPAVRTAAVRSSWQRWCRDLVNAPAQDLYPESLASAAVDKLSGIPGVTVEVWDLAKCTAEGLAGIEAVGRGSTRPGVLIWAKYRPTGAKYHVALVGKGVTFDAGGLSIKPTDGMQTMRCDMGGAATALSAFGAIAELGVAVDVDVLVPSVENLISGSSYKLGDILTYRNGVTVEIHNTDAEGRLILADALCLASEQASVSRIVDMATLTGAIIISVGSDYTGLFTADDALAEELSGAFRGTGEKAWRLPLDPAYNRLLKGTWGQIKNVGGREAGSITAALFLGHFVADGKRWAHLDIAGTAFADAPVDPYAKGGTGQVVRSLVRWAQALAEG